MPRDSTPHLVDRRRFLALGGGAVLVAACSSLERSAATSTSVSTTPTTPTAATAATAATPTSVPATSTTTAVATSTDPVVSAALASLTIADFEAVGACSLLAETAAGPFPSREQLERHDVTEGYPGHPLRLGLRVVDAACAAVPGAAVEIWHADATGDYSSFTDNGSGKDEAEGSTFLRGFQVADADGILGFHSIYPGWYPGRAVHIHVRVRLDDATVLTSQLFFDDAYSTQVFAAAPYAEFGPANTSNRADGLAGPALASGGLLTTRSGDTAAGPGTIALANLGLPT